MMFGEMVNRILERENLTRNWLAREAVFDHAHIYRICDGKRQPTRETVDRIIKALGKRASKADKYWLYRIAGFVPTKEWKRLTGVTE